MSEHADLTPCRVDVPGRRGVRWPVDGWRLPDGKRLLVKCRCNPHPGQWVVGYEGGRYVANDRVPDQRNAPGRGGGRVIGGKPILGKCWQCDGSGWRPVEEIAEGVIGWLDMLRVEELPSCYRTVPR